MPNTEAVDLLCSQISDLPDREGPLNLLPFAQDSEEVQRIKRRVCEAIVRVFENAGYSFDRNTESPTPHRVQLQCDKCEAVLISTSVDKRGRGIIPGAHTISSFQSVNPMCPHHQLTIDDHRLRIEESLSL